MLPRVGSSKLVTRWFTVTLVASIFAVLDGGWLAHWMALAPSRVWRGEVWRLITWPFVEPAPLSLVLTLASIYKFGSELAIRWGDRRLLRFMAQIVGVAAIATCVVAPILGAGYLHRLGGWAVCDALVIAWARQFPERTLVLYGMIAASGRDLVKVTIAITAIYALYSGLIAMIPELVACAAAALYPKEWLRR